MDKQDNFIKRSTFRFSLLLDSALAGLLAGFISVFYRYIIESTNSIRSVIYTHKDLTSIVLHIFLFLFFAYIIAQLLKWAPLSGGSGIPQIYGETIQALDVKPVPTFVSKLIGGALANTVGLSLGREGPSIQLGGALTKFVAQKLNKSEKETRYMITFGASAGLAAAFNAPLAATLFAAEELHKSFSHFILIPCLLASSIANFIAFQFFPKESAFSFSIIGSLPTSQLHFVLLLGIACGFAGVLFNTGLLFSQKILQERFSQPFIRFSFVLLIGLIVGYFFYDITGGGHSLLEGLAQNKKPLKLLLFLLLGKFIFTWISYGSGVQGGIFLPTLVIGGLVGAIVYTILSYFGFVEAYYINFIILGMVGILTSVVRAPVMSILLVLEMIGGTEFLLPLTLVSFSSYLIAELLKNPPIYESLFENIMKKQEQEKR